MQSFLIPLAELRDNMLAAWRDLAARAVEPNPFFEPEFVLPAAELLGPGSTALLVTAGRGEWLACLPVQFASRWRRLPLTAAASRHLYAFLGTPLVAPGATESALGPMVEQAFEGPSRARASILALEWVRGDGPVAAALGKVLDDRKRGSLRFQAFERAALERRADGDYLKNVRPHHRRELRRLGRRLGDELGEPLELRDRSGDAAAVDRFIELEAAGWKGRGATAFASLPGHADFFRTVCAAFAERGRLQMLTLMAGDRTVALKCNLIAGDEVFCFKIAHDESLARFSPGVQLETHMVDVFHEQMTQTRMDSCADADNDMINRLWPDRRPLVSYVIPAGSAAGWASARGVEAALQIHKRTRRAS
jgi:CelD/BcsL family acetyltransferase involved in cellulose biosynthesis